MITSYLPVTAIQNPKLPNTAWYALKTNRDRLDEVLVADQDALASTTDEAIRRSNYTLPSWWIEIGTRPSCVVEGC